MRRALRSRRPDDPGPDHACPAGGRLHRGQAPPPPEDPRRPTIQLASFDFPESEILGELYGQALRQHGFPVELVVQLGAREVVAPALEQGKVDMVPEYLGSALNFLNDRDRVATADPGLTHARLEQAFAPAGSACSPTPPPSTATASWSPARWPAAAAWRSSATWP